MKREWGKYCTLELVIEQIQNEIEDSGLDSNITEDEINMSVDDIADEIGV